MELDQTITEDNEAETEEEKQKAKQNGNNLQQLTYFSDTWSILRFIKGNKSQGVEISPNGKCLMIT